MNIKTGDNVMMIQGKDRGKKGQVLRVLSHESKVVVRDLNTIKRHQKARKQGQKGQIITKERPVDASSVEIICPKCSKPTRVGHIKEGKNKLRVCKQCDATF
jgi:large subunit ribosomal protein L24